MVFHCTAYIFESTECRCGKFVDRLGFHCLSSIKNARRFRKHSAINSSVSDSGQNFETQVSGSWEKKPRKTRFFSGFEIIAILSDKTQYHCEITTVGPYTIC